MRKPQTKTKKSSRVVPKLSPEAPKPEWIVARDEVPPPQQIDSASDLLSLASGIVSGSRQKTHGQKERSFQAIAAMWNTYLESRALSGTASFDITSIDVANMMTLLKITRSIQGTPTPDHYIDAAGYAGIAGELALANPKTS